MNSRTGFVATAAAAAAAFAASGVVHAQVDRNDPAMATWLFPTAAYVEWGDQPLYRDLNGDGYDDIVQMVDAYRLGSVEACTPQPCATPSGNYEWLPDESGVVVMNGFDGTTTFLRKGMHSGIRIVDGVVQARHDGLPRRWEDVYRMRGVLPTGRVEFADPNGSNTDWKGYFRWVLSYPKWEDYLLACENPPPQQRRRCEVPEWTLRVRLAQTKELVYERTFSNDDGRLVVAGVTFTWRPTLWAPTSTGWAYQWDICLGVVCGSDAEGWQSVFTH